MTKIQVLSPLIKRIYFYKIKILHLLGKNVLYVDKKV